MPDYKEATVAGTKWQRASRVVIENPYGAAPSLMFVEEEVVSTGGSFIAKPVANLGIVMDPGTPLHIEIYSKLNELYVLLREARDQEAADGP